MTGGIVHVAPVYPLEQMHEVRLKERPMALALTVHELTPQRAPLQGKGHTHSDGLTGLV